MIASKETSSDGVTRAQCTRGHLVESAPKVVSDRMGHANMSVTFQIYGHRSTGRDREATDLVGGPIHRQANLSP